MRVPSGDTRGFVSWASFSVSRVAFPPATGARQTSPRHANTTVFPSGVSEGNLNPRVAAAEASALASFAVVVVADAAATTQNATPTTDRAKPLMRVHSE